DRSQLTLGADEEDTIAVERNCTRRGLRLFQRLQCLLEINDVDSVACREDIPLHLRVPTAALVAEVDAGLQQILYLGFRHSVACLHSAQAPPHALGLTDAAHSAPIASTAFVRPPTPVRGPQQYRPAV